MMGSFEKDYYRYGGKKDKFKDRVINMLFHHNLRFLYWLRKAEKHSILGGGYNVIDIPENMD